MNNHPLVICIDFLKTNNYNKVAEKNYCNILAKKLCEHLNGKKKKLFTDTICVSHRTQVLLWLLCPSLYKRPVFIVCQETCNSKQLINVDKKPKWNLCVKNLCSLTRRMRRSTCTLRRAIAWVSLTSQADIWDLPERNAGL